MAKELGDWAKAAKMIREYLKAQGIACAVSSKSYSMGSSVNVTIYDQNPEVVAKVEEYVNRFQYGSFDGMQDLYNFDNVARSIPQVKYAFVRNEISEELKQRVWDFALGYYNGLESAPRDASQAYDFRCNNFCCYGDDIIRRLVNGGYNNNQYWEAQQVAEAA